MMAFRNDLSEEDKKKLIKVKVEVDEIGNKHKKRIISEIEAVIKKNNLDGQAKVKIDIQMIASIPKKKKPKGKKIEVKWDV